jgi:protein SCO1
VLALLAQAGCGPPALSGTDLGKRPAPDFTLTDGPTGETVTLSSLRGRVVLLTFLYTSCPDVCPLTAAKLSAVRGRLGPAAGGIALIAVSVDPARDTPEATRKFLDAHGLSGVMRYLIGDRSALQAVWTKYGIGAEAREALVAHNDAIYLIDKQGRERALLHSDVAEEALTRDLRALLEEPRLF